MRYTFAVAALVGLFVVFYALWVRPWLRRQPWAQPFYNWVAPLERVLFKNSETILFARLKMLTGVVLTVLTQIGTIDLTPLMPFIPEKHRTTVQAIINALPMVITLVGLADERLRNTTTQPIEIVALPQNAPLPPSVAIAVADAELAKETAIEVIKQKVAA